MRYSLMVGVVVGCAIDKVETHSKAASTVPTPVATPDTQAAAPAASPLDTTAASAKMAAEGASEVESKEILLREKLTDKAKVKHVLLGWDALGPAYRGRMDPRAKARTAEQAETLVKELLGKIEKGAPIDQVMSEFSEDPGSAKTGRAYDASPSAGLVPPFKALSLRLKVEETGVVKTRYGYHVIQRVE